MQGLRSVQLLAAEPGSEARKSAMEFTILDAFNVPPKPVLAVHTGTVRRQVKLEVNQPFTVPDPGSKTAPVEVSVFQQLASQLLPDEGKPETTCAIPVRRPDGTATQVKLKIKTGSGGTASTGNGASPEDDSLAFTKDYLDSHHLQQRVQGLIQDVLREQPLDPYRYMLNQLRKVQAGEESLPEVPKKEGEALAESIKEKEPMMPKPPEQPKSGRPAPNASRTNKVALDTSAWKPSVFVVRSLLESPACQAVGEASVRALVALQASKGLSVSIVDRARERAVKKALSESTPKEQAKVLIRSCVKTAALYLSREYNRALTKWSVSCLLRNVVEILGQSSVSSSCLRSVPEMLPEPKPFVFLNTSASWAEWLSPATSKASTPSRRSITPRLFQQQ